MPKTFEELSAQLSQNDIRPSYQRIKILDYLYKNRCHPTVDKIYTDLLPEIPTLSKTTVYNTLNSFLEASLVMIVNIEDNETRYDIDTREHGHFKCDNCGTVVDFVAELHSLKNSGLDGFLIKERNIYYKGLCPHCLNTLN